MEFEFELPILLGGYLPGIFSSIVDTLSFDFADVRSVEPRCGRCEVLTLVNVGPVVDMGEVAVDAIVEEAAPGEDDRVRSAFRRDSSRFSLRYVPTAMEEGVMSPPVVVSIEVGAVLVVWSVKFVLVGTVEALSSLLGCVLILSAGLSPPMCSAAIRASDVLFRFGRAGRSSGCWVFILSCWAVVCCCFCAAATLAAPPTAVTLLFIHSP